MEHGTGLPIAIAQQPLEFHQWPGETLKMFYDRVNTGISARAPYSEGMVYLQHTNGYGLPTRMSSIDFCNIFAVLSMMRMEMG